MIKNPVLKGFHPDPCMICVEDTFYIANSTFEYYPPLQISKSKDLANWENLGGILTEEHVSLVGNPPSGGVWAPSLTYKDGLFYIVYSDIKSWSKSPFKDVDNFITYSKNIEGPWSKGIYINSSGFDASLFHDEDKKYFINMEWDYREKGNNQFTGILITELDSKTLLPITKAVKVYEGTDRGLIEGPHIFKRNNWYYLIAAEGGTSYEHAVTIARSRNIYGPYETHPNKHLATSYKVKDAPIHKTGHGSLCEGPDGRWFLATLCGRPLPKTKYCPLGRETAIDEVVWKNDWPYLKNETSVMSSQFNGYGEKTDKRKIIKYKLNSDIFKKDFMSLREKLEYRIENDSIIIKGGNSPISRHNQKLLAKRVEDFNFEFSIMQNFIANSFQEFSGLMYRYDEDNFYFLYISKNRNNEDIINIYSRINTKDNFMKKEGIVLKDFKGTINLKIIIEEQVGYFYYKLNNNDNYFKIPYKLEPKYLSDESADPMGFTGGFVGMEVVDLEYKRQESKFSNLIYYGKD